MSRAILYSYELSCSVMLGLGQLFVFTGYDAESFLLESVIHSIHEREPDRIDPYAGYYGQAVIHTAYTIGCLFSSSILNEFGAKMTLFTAASCFVLFPLGFLFTNSFYFYFSTLLLGFGYSLFYQGHGAYLMSHSTRRSIESNVSISMSIGTSCLILVAAILAGITAFTATSPNDNNSSLIDQLLNRSIFPNSNKIERRYSDFEIRLLFSSLAAFGFLAMIIFWLLPSRDADNCIESGEKRQDSFTDGLRLTIQTFHSSSMLKLIPVFLFCGLHLSFWISILPTSLNFNMHNSDMIYLPAIYSLGVGIGEVFTGVVISMMSRRIENFGLKPCMIIGTILTFLYCFLVLISTPYDSPMRPTNEEPLLFQTGQPFVFMLAIAIGISDCCINSSRSVICALAMPEKRNQVFATSRLYQAFASCIIFFLSPHLNIYFYVFGIPVFATVSIISFCHVTNQTHELTCQETKLKKAIDGCQN